jgi:hypothetical protein
MFDLISNVVNKIVRFELLLVLLVVRTAAAQPLPDPAAWWSPGDPRVLPAVVEYENAFGRLRVLNPAGPTTAAEHPFFAPLGTNGRACVTCHQPADGMGLSVDTIRRRWEATNGRDPLFAAIDGADCPNLPQDAAASHSLLLERGLFRVFLPWPPRTPEGDVIEPEFAIEVVSDPTGCNTDPTYGLTSDDPTISVYRRPRPVANLKYITELSHGVPPHDHFYPNDKSLLPKDPDTGAFVAHRLMSDGREPTLKTQAIGASRAHLQSERPNEEQLAQIVSFESQVYAAQSFHDLAGDLTGPGTPPGLGPEALRDGAPARLGNNPINRIFGSFAMWADSAETDRSAGGAHEKSEFRRSVARGADLFYLRRFMIRDVGDYNDKGLGNPFHRSCGSGCHNMTLMGTDLAPGYMDLGLNNYPWANNRPDLPLFKVVCDADARPQSYLGRTIFTHDPGRALITGKCIDVGATLTQQMRGLAARPPYFANGSAANLRELIDFYDRRFNIGYTEQEKQDLVNFMTTL